MGWLILPPDYVVEWEILVEVARFFKGSLQVPDLIEMTFKEVYFWYKLEERKIIEENILYDFQKNDKPLPDTNALRKLVDKKIEEKEAEIRRINGRE